MEASKVISVQIIPVKRCYIFTVDFQDCHFIKFIRFTTFDDGSSTFHPIFEFDLTAGFGYNDFGHFCIDGNNRIQNLSDQLHFDSINKEKFDLLVSKFPYDEICNQEKSKFWKSQFEINDIKITP